MVDSARRVSRRARRFVLASWVGAGRLEREQNKQTAGSVPSEALAKLRLGPVIGLKLNRAGMAREDGDLNAGEFTKALKTNPHVTF